MAWEFYLALAIKEIVGMYAAIIVKLKSSMNDYI